MSLVGWRVSSGAVATGTALKTIQQVVAASNHGVAVRGFGFSFAGTSNTDAPGLCQAMRQTTAGTMSSNNPTKDPDDTDETLQTTGQNNATAEPTAGAVLWAAYVHPQQGIEVQLPFDKPMKIGGGDRIGFTTTFAVSVNCVVQANGDE